MPGTYRTRAEEMQAAGASPDQIKLFALLAIADQLKAQNEIDMLKIMLDRGLPTNTTPSDADLAKIRRHLWKVLGWQEPVPRQDDED